MRDQEDHFNSTAHEIVTCIAVICASSAPTVARCSPLKMRLRRPKASRIPRLLGGGSCQSRAGWRHSGRDLLASRTHQRHKRWMKLRALFGQELHKMGGTVLFTARVVQHVLFFLTPQSFSLIKSVFLPVFLYPYYQLFSIHENTCIIQKKHEDLHAAVATRIPGGCLPCILQSTFCTQARVRPRTAH